MRNNGQYTMDMITLFECTWVTRKLQRERLHEKLFSFGVQRRFYKEVTCELLRDKEHMTACDSDTMKTQVPGERISGREKSDCKGPKLGRILIKHDTEVFLVVVFSRVVNILFPSILMLLFLLLLTLIWRHFTFD